MNWQVVPICERQLRDVNPADLLNDGLYRKCNTYKGGGGYDQFPKIYAKRYGIHGSLHDQFVVQLYGCYFKCPYCYVTPDGVFGAPVEVNTDKLIEDFIASGCTVFHLMGGAPDMQYEHWVDIMKKLPEYAVFHSDLMLAGPEYKVPVLWEWGKYDYLHAVSIKGGGTAEFANNTGKEPDWEYMLQNLDALCSAEVHFYVTFTGMTPETIQLFKERCDSYGISRDIFADAFPITIRHYAALD